MQYACIICGAPALPGESPRGRRCAKHPLRLNPRGSGFEAKRRRVLFRDGWYCKVRLEGCTGRATTVDHIVHVRDGGSDEESNLRASCAHCNSKRGGGAR